MIMTRFKYLRYVSRTKVRHEYSTYYVRMREHTMHLTLKFRLESLNLQECQNLNESELHSITEQRENLYKSRKIMTAGNWSQFGLHSLLTTIGYSFLKRVVKE